MKRIIYKSINYTDFKGQMENIAFDSFLNTKNVISGRNGVGKTTILESMMFTLIGKGLMGESIQNTPMISGDIKKDYLQELELTVLVNDEPYIIKRCYVDAIDKNKVATTTLKEMSINGEAFKKKKDFEKAILDILGFSNTEQLLLQTNPRYFRVYKKSDLISYFTKMVKNNVSDYAILNDSNDIDHEVKNTIFNQLETNIPLESQFEDVTSKVKYCKNQAILLDTKFESKTESYNSITGKVDVVINIDNLKEDENMLLQKLAKLKLDRDTTLQQNNGKNILINDLATAQSRLSNAESKVYSRTESIKTTKKSIEFNREQFDKLNAIEPQSVCTTCGKVNEKGLDAAKKHHKNELDRFELNGKTLNSQLDIDRIALNSDETILTSAKQEVESLKQKINDFIEVSFDSSEIDAVNESINDNIKKQSNQNSIHTLKQQVDEVALEIEKNTDELNTYEIIHLTLKKLLQEKASKTEAYMNKEIGDPTIKVSLFRITKEGNLKPDFNLLINDLSYDRLNLASQINAGIALINFIQKSTEIISPLFIDNAESVINVYKPNGQWFESRVTLNDLEVN